MKRWLKSHGRWLIVGLGVLFIGNGIYGLITTDTEWRAVVHVCVIAVWAFIIFLCLGLVEKVFNWWEKE